MQATLQELEISPEMFLVISKQNAKEFHNQVKARVMETGAGLMEFTEFVRFIEKVSEAQAADTEWKDMVRTEIAKYGKEAFITPRGVKFEAVETGTKYSFENCNDPVLEELELAAQAAADALKARKDFLKTVHPKGMDFITSDGVVVNLYPPSKSSVSSFKVTLPK